MTDIAKFFLGSKASVISIEAIEITHPSFDQGFYFLKNGADQLNLTHEDGSSHLYKYVPMSITISNVRSDLDQEIQINISDLDDKFIDAIDAIDESTSRDIRPLVRYRLYRDDMLSTPISIIQSLGMVDISKNSNGDCTINAKAQSLNSVRTGENYSLERFPLLRGYV